MKPTSFAPFEEGISLVQALLLLFVVAAVGAISLLLGIRARFRRRPSSTRNPAKVLIVLGSGGHTAEMLALAESLDHSKYTPVTWVLADTDKTSLPRLEREKSTAKKGLLLSEVDSYEVIPRSREVGQSYVTSVWSTLKATAKGVSIVLRSRPDIVLVNGPGTCVPIIVGAVILRVFYGSGYPKLVFIESFCRVKSLSLTGKLLYPIADRFIVQWPDLCASYHRAEYLGAIY